MLVLLLLLVEKNIIMQSSSICNQAANCQTIPIRTRHQLSLLRVLVVSYLMVHKFYNTSQVMQLTNVCMIYVIKFDIIHHSTYMIIFFFKINIHIS